MVSNRASPIAVAAGGQYKSGSDHDGALQKPLLPNSVSGYRMGMGSRQSLAFGSLPNVGTMVGARRQRGKDETARGIARIRGLWCTHFYARWRPVSQVPKDGEGI